MSLVSLFPLYISFILTILFSTKITTAFNISKILTQSSDFSSLNDFLAKTQLAEAINGRQTVTILAVDNGKLSSLNGKSTEELKMILSLHAILDYYDVPKLQHLPNKSVIVTTLFQSSGQARGQQGFLNISSSGDRVAFGSAVPGSTLIANLVKSIASEPYNISVLHVSNIVVPPGLGSGGGGGGGGGGNSTSPPTPTPTPPSSNSSSPAPGGGGSGAAPPANNNNSNTSPTPTSPPKGSTTPPTLSPLSPGGAGGGRKQAPAPSNGKPPGGAAAPSKSSPGGKAPAPSAGSGAPSGDAAFSPATEGSSPPGASADAPTTADTPANSPPAMAIGPNGAETPGTMDGPAADAPAEGSSANSPPGINFATVFLIILSLAWALA